ncbi:hypothetical protein OAP83_02900, partial [Rickettsiales bacterium]|nr:hypothetical protein [Rickettsiales bacterium]
IVLMKIFHEHIIDEVKKQGLLDGLSSGEIDIVNLVVEKSIVRNHQLSANIANIREFYFKDKSHRENFTKAFEKIKLNVAVKQAQEQLETTYADVEHKALEIITGVVAKNNDGIIKTSSEMLELNPQMKDKVSSNAIKKLASNCFSHNSGILVLPCLASFVQISKFFEAADTAFNAAREFYKVLLENDEVIGFLKEVDISSLDASDLTSEDIDLVNAYLAHIGCMSKIKSEEVHVPREQVTAEVTVSKSQTFESFEGEDIKAAYEYLAKLDSSAFKQDSCQVLANEFVTNYYKDKILTKDHLVVLVGINDNFSEGLSKMIFNNPDLKKFVNDNAEFLLNVASEIGGTLPLFQKIDPEFGVSAKGASMSR